METMNKPFPWLELVEHPAFCVKNRTVIAANTAAEHRMIRVNMDVNDFFTENLDVYNNFKEGSLYLTVTIGETPYDTRITRTLEYDIFVIRQKHDDKQLRALALAAQQLRIPLANVMTVTDRLLTALDTTDSVVQEQAGQINRSLFQLLRIISNMSDTDAYQNALPFSMHTIDFVAVFDEIVEKAKALTDNKRIAFHYTCPDSPVFGLANTEKLERAIYNLLSNAFKFAKENTSVDAKLAKTGNFLSFSICNTSSKPAEDTAFWTQYSREPAIEDNRNGLGLGMSLVCSVAAAHNGTVLVDHPTPEQTRVTMTVAIANDAAGTVRSPITHIGDYAGGRDKGLLELADILPSDSYEKIN